MFQRFHICVIMANNALTDDTFRMHALHAHGVSLYKSIYYSILFYLQIKYIL